MVAIQTALGMAGAIGTYQFAGRLPQLHADPRLDAAIKAALGLAAIVAAAKVDNGALKTAILAAGVGLTAASATMYLGR